MKLETVVSSSDQITSSLPSYIVENYERFVEFMQEGLASQERMGFGQDLLQNLHRYRDFSTYNKDLREFDYLKEDLGTGGVGGAQGIEVLGTSNDYSIVTDQLYELALGDTSVQIILNNADGFPLENGVLLVDDEIILYQYREDNVFYGLLRGASGTSILPSFTLPGEYHTDTEVATHTAGTKVYNLSILFLVGMLSTIHESFVPSVSSDRLHPDINRSPLLKNIKDFYQSKGTKLGIKAFFKMLFGENDVQVRYPGDQMIRPSHSTWVQNRFLRVIPIPQTLCDPKVKYGLPSKIIGNQITYKSYLDKKEKNIYAKAVTDYVSTYMFGDDIQYELSLVPDSIEGDFLANPNTVLTRKLDSALTAVDSRRDVNTITVESTLGFPDKGVLFIGDEGIFYESKSFNQFFGCIRGYRGVETTHELGKKVYGPYFIESSYVEDGETFVTRSWPLGLVSDVRVDDGGILHTTQDEVVLNGPGRVDYREPILSSFDDRENYTDELAEAVTTIPELPYIGNYTWGVDGVYFNHDYVFVSSSNLPNYPVGLFSNNNSVGPGLQGEFAIHIIPRRESIQPNDEIKHKGIGGIGVFVDGVPAYSNVSEERLVQGRILDFNIHNEGEGYITPTVLINDESGLAEVEVDTNLGHILSVTSTSNKSYQGEPSVKITSGRKAEILLQHDVYGRVISASVTNRGEYYYDVPKLVVIDKSGRGKGAVLRCTVDGNGVIDSVRVSHSGIDYNPSTTSVQIIPVGEAAQVTSNVEYYEFNRWDVIESAPNQFFDEGNGFLYPDRSGERNKFAYIANPTKLREQLEDNGFDHSPLIGWAFDGNPIYGPVGYRDGKTRESGLVRQKSGYRKFADRADMVPANGTEPGVDPPDTAFPTGIFVQDYYHDDRPFSSETPDGNDVLDVYNGKVCNTPEFPVELYPDGVYCYFITVESDGTPAFPYIIGPTFKNRPISQRVNVTDHEELTPITFKLAEPSATYDTKVIDFDFTLIERYRNEYLESTKEGIKLEVSDISQGHVSGIKVEDGAPYNRIVGDYLYFDDTDTRGQGAVGRITHIWGTDVLENHGVRNATVTRLISHHQQIDLRHYRNLPLELGAARKVGTIQPGQEPSESLYPDAYLPVRTGDYFIYTADGTAWNGDEVHQNDWAIARGFGSNVTWSNDRYYTNGELIFIEGSSIYTSSGAQAVVETYEDQILTVHTNTPNLILAGDTFFDAKLTVVEILSTEVIDEDVAIVDGGNDVRTIEDFELIHNLVITEDSEMYILDESGLNNLLTDEDVGGIDLPSGSPFTFGSSTFLGDFIPEDEDNLKTGDLWWSEQTGRLYIYYAGDWICTQPIGTKPMIGASNTGIGTHEPTTQTVYHPQTERTVTISTQAPQLRTDGSNLIEGDLWWSQHTGILYIYYEGVWACTDPNGSIPQSPYDAGGREFEFDPDPGNSSVGLKVIVSFKSPEAYSPVIGADGREYLTILGTDPDNLLGQDITLDITENGTLWWSPGGIGTGMMYIRYDSTWVITNPVASLSSIYSLDTSAPDGGGQLPGGGGQGPGGGSGGVGSLSEKDDQTILYFRNTATFNVGDIIEFKVGAPGVNANEKARIIQKLPQNGLVVERGVEGTDAQAIPDGTKTENLVNFVYVIRTTEPHGLNDGDEIVIEGSRYDEINGPKIIDRAGKVKLALGEGVVTGGQITDVTLFAPGQNYPQEVLVKFTGGGGSGARGLADVNPVTGEIVDVIITHPGDGYTSAPTAIFGSELPDDMIFIYTSEYYEEDDLIKYSFRRNGIQGEAAYAEVISGGVGYESIPPIIGSYPGLIDRAVLEVTSDPLKDLGIDNINVAFQGNRYVNPIVIIYDEDRRGSGAEATAQVENGKIVNITVTNPGEGYVIPQAFVVEQDGKYIPITDTIGSIRAFKVIDPGRALSADRSLKPEILITTRCIVSPTEDNVGVYVPGSVVYQGHTDYRLVTAEVVDYEEDKQVVVLKNVDGNLRDNEILYQEATDTQFFVVKEGQADCSIVVDAESAKVGRWYDDTSKISEELAVIQDSYYYQWFSYVIASPLPQIKYETFLNKTIHPAGFKLFSDLRIKAEVTCDVTPEDFINETISRVTLLGPSGDKFTYDSVTQTVLGRNDDGAILETDVDDELLNN
jgi:hypothetical protein